MIGEDIFKLGVESLNFPFYIIDAVDYKVIFANSSAELIYGECDPTIKCHMLTHKKNTPCKGEEHPCPLEKVKNTKKPVIEKHIHYDQSGKSFNFEIHCHPIFDDKGNVVQVIEYSHDLTRYEELQKQQMRLLNYVSDAVISTDLNFSIIDWNKAAEQIYGWRKKEVLGKTVGEITQIEYPYDNSEDIIEKFMKDGIWQGEVIQKRKDGTPLNILASVALVKDETGTPETTLAVNRDITKRVQAEEELRQRTNDFKERVKELSCLYEVSRLLREPNPSLNKIFQSIVEIISSTWQYPSITCSRITYQQETYKSLNFQVTPWFQDVRIIAFGKEVGSLEVYYLEEKETLFEGPFLMEERRLIDVLGQEISKFIERQMTVEALKSSQEKLNEVNQLFENIFNTTDTLIANLDPQFNFIWVNRAYAHADEREPRFFPSKNHFDLYPNEENEEIFKNVIKTGKPHYSIAKPFEYAEHPERGVSYWDWSLIPIKDLSSKISGLVLTLQDVTDRIQMQEALKKSEEKYKNITELSQEIILRITLEG
ncbi:MAG: PAS domain-containing protein, partial [Candidatus Hodarchaeota archaeon]